MSAASGALVPFGSGSERNGAPSEPRVRGHTERRVRKRYAHTTLGSPPSDPLPLPQLQLLRLVHVLRERQAPQLLQHLEVRSGAARPEANSQKRHVPGAAHGRRLPGSAPRHHSPRSFHRCGLLPRVRSRAGGDFLDRSKASGVPVAARPSFSPRPAREAGSVSRTAWMRGLRATLTRGLNVLGVGSPWPNVSANAGREHVR